MRFLYPQTENVHHLSISPVLRKVSIRFIFSFALIAISASLFAQNTGKANYKIISENDGGVRYEISNGGRIVFSEKIGKISDNPQAITAFAEKKAKAALRAYQQIGNFPQEEITGRIKKQMANDPEIAQRIVPEGACTYNSTIDGTDASMPDRLLRPGGTPASCAVPVACPGPFGGGTFFYETYTLTNTTGSNQCVTVNINWVSGTGTAVHVTAYSGSFNPAALCTNFLADPLTSAISGTPQSFSFDVANGATVVLVATSPNGGDVNYTMTVNGLYADPVIVSQPLPQSFCGSGTPTFSVGATGVGLGYQWERSTDGGTTYLPIAGANAASYSPGPVTIAANGYLYRCVVTTSSPGCSGSVTSTAALLTVNPLPTHSGVAASPNPVCTNTTGSTTITGTASGGTVGGTGTFSSGTINLAIPDNNPAGASHTIALPSLNIANAGDLKVRINATHTWVGDLRFTLTSPCGTTFLFDRPGLATSTGCCGNSADLGGVYTFDLSAATVIPETGGGPVIAPGSYRPSDLVGNPHNWAGVTFPCTAAGNWTLTGVDGASGDLGNLIDWAIEVTGGYTHTLTGPGTITQNPSSGPNNATGSFTVSGLAPGTYNYTFTSTDAVGCSVSTNVSVQVNPIPSLTISPSSAAICPGGIVQLSATGAGGGLTTFSSAGAITIPAGAPGTTSGVASPYPSTINVTGLPTGGVNVATVSLNNMNHTFPGDIDIVLQSPSGQNVILMSDAGGGTDIVNVNLVFSDGAAGVLPAVITSGTYRPTNIGAGDNYPAPGPLTAPTSTTLSTFTGDPNGTWRLFVVDDAGGDFGNINGGWSITFNAPAPANAVFTPQNGLFNNSGATIPYTGTAQSTVWASPVATTTYTATTTVNGCTSAPVNVTVTVNPVTTIATQPANSAVICAGSAATFSVVAAGTAPFTYQWQISTTGAGGPWTNLANAAPYSGVTTATLTINPVTASMNNYLYRCVVTGGCGSATSNAGTLTVDQLAHTGVSANPAVTCSPGSTTIAGTAVNGTFAGGLVTLGSSGTVNLPIPDNNTTGVNSTIVLPASTIPNANSLRVRINATHSWVGDVRFTLTSPCGVTYLFDRPGLNTSTGCCGNSADLGGVYTFDLSAATVIPETGGGPVIAPGSYRPSDLVGNPHNWAGLTFPCSTAGNWVLNATDGAGGDVGTLIDWSIIAPAPANYLHTLTGPGTISAPVLTGTNNATATFSVTNIPAGNHTYVFTSTDGNGCSVSTNVSVLVNPTPVVTITPAAPVICAGSIQQLNAGAVPGTSQTFNSATLNLAIPDNNPTGVNTPAITLPAGVSIANAADLRVRINANHTWVGDLKFTLTSPCGTTFLFDRPGVPASTFGNSQNLGGNYTFDLSAATILPETNSGPATIPAGSYLPSNTAGAAHTWAGLTFPCAGTGNWTLNMSDNGGGDVGSLVDWGIIVNSPTPVVFSPITHLYTNATATIPYTGTPVTTVYAMPPTTTTYTATATLAGCTSAPASVTVTVNQLPAITVQPQALAAPICPGFNVNYSVTATGTGLTYQWQLSTDNGTTWTNLVNNGTQYAGVTTATLTLLNVQTTQNGHRFRVIVSGVCPPPVTSSSVTLVVATPPTITTQPANVTVCAGTNATFNVVATGVPAPNIYQWQVSTNAGVTWTNLTTGGSYTPTLTVSPTTTALNNNRYRVIVTNSCGQNVTSNAVILTVNPLPVVSATDLWNRRICISDTLVPLVGTPTGGSWSGIGVSGFNFVPTATAIGTYTLTYTFTNSFGCTASDTTKAIVVDCPERIRLLRDNAVILFPNPNGGQFNIRINSVLYNYLGMNVYNSAGQLISQKVFSGLAYGRVVPINLTHLPSGVYMVKFFYDDGIRTSEKTFPVIIGRQ
jgi:subtilisin-like proprotein convertase family protein